MIKTKLVFGEGGSTPPVAGYKWLEYLESDGHAYIDTGIKPTSHDFRTSIDVWGDFQLGNVQGYPNYSYGTILFANYGTGVSVVAWGGGPSGDGFLWSDGYDSTGCQFNMTVKNQRQKIYWEQVQSGDTMNVTKRNETLAVEYEGTFNVPPVPTNNLRLFDTMYFAPMKIYSAQISVDGHDSWDRNLIPARRNSDNALGMYDLVTGSFYTNAGSGSFTGGPELDPVLDDSVLYDVVYNHNVNNGSQLTVGTVASAELTFRSEEQLNIGDTFKYFCSMTQDEGEVDNFVQKGVFIVKEMNKDRNIYSYTCYDNISKFDVVVDDWYNSLTYPINIAYDSANTVLGTLCTYLGITEYECQNKCNGSWNINSKKFDANFLTGRYILGLCAKIAGGYACADEQGKIWLRTFGKDNYTYDAAGNTTFVPPSVTLTNADYTKLTIANYDCPRINQLNIQYNYNGDVYQIGWSHQPETGRQPSILDLKGNQWTYDHTQQQIKDNYWDCPDGSFWRFQDYRPCKVELLVDYGLEAGDYFYVTDFDENTHLALVMSKRVSASGVQFECIGNQIRDEVAAQTEQQIDLSKYVPKNDLAAAGINIGTASGSGGDSSVKGWKISDVGTSGETNIKPLGVYAHNENFNSALQGGGYFIFKNGSTWSGNDIISQWNSSGGTVKNSSGSVTGIFTAASNRRVMVANNVTSGSHYFTNTQAVVGIVVQLRDTAAQRIVASEYYPLYVASYRITAYGSPTYTFNFTLSSDHITFGTLSTGCTVNVWAIY